MSTRLLFGIMTITSRPGEKASRGPVGVPLLEFDNMTWNQHVTARVCERPVGACGGTLCAWILGAVHSCSRWAPTTHRGSRQERPRRDDFRTVLVCGKSGKRGG